MKAVSAQPEETLCHVSVHTQDPELFLQSWIRVEIHRLLLSAPTPTLELALAYVLKLMAEVDVGGG